ncbi:MAG: gliding motility-associated C-terminal domain-containing protein [Bacteroidota bacterium]|nr:gliding motility-associated C-terminal domain-containing protein [Bacteroidota bacterium]MDX5506787.1 gliding motility-associated C-terminal domain-containing protein [Bacteroidota bacterium]
MRKLLLLLTILFLGTFAAEASHLAGGDIQYRYIGDSTGISHHYKIILRLYRDVTGIPLGNTANVTVASSCFSNQNVTCTLVPGTGTGNTSPTLFDCVNPSPSLKTLDIYAYIGYVVLPGKCADFRFYYTNCCRPGGYTNANATGSFYFEARLNNFLGNNSSPIFVSEPVRSFCVGKTFNWKQSNIEYDGDSIWYDFIAPRLTGPTDFQNFNAGWSAQQPISSTPPIVMNPVSGLITFTPTQQEVDVAAIIINEYRFDTLYNQWVHIGSSNRDMTVNIGGACKASVQDGVVMDYNQPGTYVDPTTGLPTRDYDCNSTTVTLIFKTPLDCASVDRSDFRLTSPIGQPIPVLDLVPNCDPNGDALTMDVVLYKPLFINGDYFLYSKKGNDGNTLVNKCGFPMDEFDTIVLRVSNCPVLNWDLENVTIEEDKTPIVEWTWDNSKIPAGLFNEFQIFRSDDNGATFNLIGTETDSTKKSYRDNSFQWQQNLLDQQTYLYQVQVIVDNQPFGPSRDVTTILLEGSWNVQNPEIDTIALSWNLYNGWGQPQYTVMLGKEEAGTWNWSQASSTMSSNPTNAQSYIFLTENLDAGNYALRVDAKDPVGGGTYVSESNWVRFEIPKDPINPPKPIIVPNVLTPNGDMVNDVLIIKNIGTFSTSRKMIIWDRWGNTVFETDMYDNLRPFAGETPSGGKLADGVYFYILNLEDAPSNTKQNFEGTITILGNATGQ